MGDFIMEQEDKNMQAEPSEAQENPKKQPQPKGYEAYLSLFDLVGCWQSLRWSSYSFSV